MSPTDAYGGTTSGNSSVFSLRSATRPKTTSATIATTVTSGRLMAKSEMNIGPSTSLGLCGAVVHRAHANDRVRCQPLRSPDEHRVAGGEPLRDLHRLGAAVLDAERDRGLLRLAVPDARDRRDEILLVDRARRDDEAVPRLARDVPLREQPADEGVASVRYRREDAHLARRRVGDRVDARDATGEGAARIALHGEGDGHA